ncbi:MAG: hypothetical protein EZS28_019987 [Streblomastix strix]|uniref:Uncharacterized protein n=1 Tax=Streblomastix strix TaxID=222440 RepID=A0A5J4VQF1_9EUKA|nr:MAG: hypothetical protein EZS28_019987 [Streblomastix strix]
MIQQNRQAIYNLVPVFILAALLRGLPGISSLVYLNGVWNDAGGIEFDVSAKGVAGDFEITDANPFKDGISVKDQSFYALTKEQVADLSIFIPLTQNEKSCNYVLDQYERNIYSALGIIAKFVANVDIAPSITHLIKNSPNSVKFHNRPLGTSDLYKDEEFTLDCSLITNFTYLNQAIKKEGVVSSKCIPNVVNIPENVSKCVDETIEYKTYLKNFTEGRFIAATENTLRELLIRFGPVYVTDSVVIGWEGDNFTVVKFNDDQVLEVVDEPKSRFVLNVGWVLFEVPDAVAVVKIALKLILTAVILPIFALFI